MYMARAITDFYIYKILQSIRVSKGLQLSAIRAVKLIGRSSFKELREEYEELEKELRQITKEKYEALGSQNFEKGVSLLRSSNKFSQILIQVNTRVWKATYGETRRMRNLEFQSRF
ncbi:hypothetical protein AgCh_031130 [Apium graveolens]